ncbi:hypothetical protein OIE43_43835 [Streptomyces pseudovenezuelae]|uniref:Uncharacterized protein n=1 Tax=Streptomyces pseudovenezuelae TaxID=67350 RepID=A0ABZ1XA45_9ACTN|nr:hypothetical protein [Streptomyces pseudovenezuelae]
MPAAANNPPRLPAEALASVEQRVLWLSVAMVDHADHVRENPSGLKAGGHQAASAPKRSRRAVMGEEPCRNQNEGFSMALKAPASTGVEAMSTAERLVARIRVPHQQTSRDRRIPDEAQSQNERAGRPQGGSAA